MEEGVGRGRGVVTGQALVRLERASGREHASGRTRFRVRGGGGTEGVMSADRVECEKGAFQCEGKSWRNVQSTFAGDEGHGQT